MDYFDKKSGTVDQKLSHGVSRFMLTPYLVLPLIMILSAFGYKMIDTKIDAILLAIVGYFALSKITYTTTELEKHCSKYSKDELRDYYKKGIYVTTILVFILILFAFSSLNKIKL